MQRLTVMDHLVLKADALLRTMAGQLTTSTRQNPAIDIKNPRLNETERKKVAGMMRVNHVGEVCAQALYQGQALTARSVEIKKKMTQAADEEVDHLMWCQERLTELDSHTSYLNPVWYMSSLMIGIVAGLAGDRINLGFLAETERQVERHLTEHLNKLPAQDNKTRCILEKMREDESQHAITAEAAGAIELPAPVKWLMQAASKVMTTTAHWL